MSKEKVIKHLEDVIRVAAREIKRQKSAKSDQMRQLASLTNAYSRLLFQSEELEGAEIDPAIEGSSTYYDEMVRNQS